MANGYARVSGRPGIVTTIPGPGFTYALTGLAEAWLDSVPLLHIVPGAREIEGREFALQAIDQRAMAGPIVKQLFRADSPCAIATAAVEGYRLAAAGEPGPVMRRSARRGFRHGSGRGHGPSRRHRLPRPRRTRSSPDIAAAISRAPRVLLYLGAGALGAAAEVRALADATGAAIATTTSGRGVVSEDEARVVVRDPGMQDLAALAGTGRARGPRGRRRLQVLAQRRGRFPAAAAAREARHDQRGGTVEELPGDAARHGGRGDASIAAILPRLAPRPAGGSGWDAAELAPGAHRRCASRRMPASSLVTKAQEHRRARSCAGCARPCRTMPSSSRTPAITR